jgi:hypothetical protein
MDRTVLRQIGWVTATLGFTALLKLALKANNNKCLDLNGGATASGTKVIVNDCNGSDTQEAWTITTNTSAGTFTFKNLAANLCLDVTGGSSSNGTQMEIYSCNGGSNQKFKGQATQ